MLTTLVLGMSLLLFVEGANQTAQFQMTQHSGNSFQGSFCFPLQEAVVGWEIVIEFTTGISGLQQWEGDWIETHSASECATHWTLVNKQYQGAHPAGFQLCLRVSGTVCGSGNPAGTATLVDLSHDSASCPIGPQVAGAQTMKYNYPEVLMKSILFYEAQRSGRLPADNRIPWRGDSALQDQGANGQDLTGGWYDAGDNVKFNFPMAFSTTVLCWSLLEFPEAYRQSGQLDYMYSSIRWPLEYLVKCHTGPNELYVQVGDGGVDHGQWTSPELMDQNRPAFKIDAAHPGSDVAGETAAAMACGYLAFKTKDPTFANTLLTHAKQIYDFAKNHKGIYSASVNAAAAYYQSSNYTDELTWSAAWLQKATEDNSYLHDAETTYASGAAWGFAWDEKLFGNMVLLYDATHNDIYRNDIIATMTSWSKAGGMTYTPKCLAFRLQWGALRYASNTAFVSLLAAKRGINAANYQQWAMCQIHYALGDSGRSFVVGYGVNPPTQPHHRASSCPSRPAPCNWEAQQNPGPNPHVLCGALVGGPGANDDYVDSRTDYIHNEVATDYNAGFQGAIAGLLQLAIDHALPDPTHCGSC